VPPETWHTAISGWSRRGLWLAEFSSVPAGRLADVSQPTVEIRRSRRRKRSVQAYRDGAKIVVMMPASLSAAEEKRWVDTMVQRIERRELRRVPTDDALMERAARLSTRYLDGCADGAKVRWVDNQRSRWGSCTPSDRTIRLSRRLQGMPEWVLDYVLLHELTHLIEPDHGARFWQWLERYPRTERARGFLDGAAMAAGLPQLLDD